MKPDISIIIITEEVSKYLEHCIDNIQKSTTLSYEIIVVDIGSGSEDTNTIGNIPQVEYVSYHYMDLGSAYNYGIKHSKANHIIILSPKINVRPGWDTTMVDFSRLFENIGIVGQSKNGTTPSSTASSEFHVVENLDENYLLIKRELIDSIGIFDSKFSSTNFIFNDFFLRARFAGFELLHCKEFYVEKKYDGYSSDNIDYLNIYHDDRNKFIDKWKKFLPVKNDLISEILKKLPMEGRGDILFLGDIPIIPNTLMKRGYNVNWLPRSAGYNIISDKRKHYDIIILFDNITHEQGIIKLLEDGRSILNSHGLIVANIYNSLFIERIHHIFKGNFSIGTFDENIKYPIRCLSKPEIISSGDIAQLELMYLVGFASKPPPEYQKLFKEICKTSLSYDSLKEELCIEEYLVVWQKK